MFFLQDLEDKELDIKHLGKNIHSSSVFQTSHLPDLSTMCRDPDLVKRIGAATALEVRATGIPYTFALCIAVIYTIDIANSIPLHGDFCVISFSDY